MTAIARPLFARPASGAGESALGGIHVETFETVYAKHARYIAGVIHRVLGGGDAEVDDLVQETFIDAFEGLARLEDPLAVRAWLVTVAARRARRVLARRRRRAFFAFWAKDYGPQSSDPRDRQPVDDLYDALGRIPADLRVPWVLHRVEQLSLPETALACEVSLATVKRRIADAEDRLERRFGYVPPDAARDGRDARADVRGPGRPAPSTTRTQEEDER